VNLTQVDLTEFTGESAPAMTVESWLSLVLLCMLGAMSPGPSLAVVLGSLLRDGQRAGLAAAFAHGLAVGLYALLTVAGLAAVVASSSRLFALLQLAAAGYLLFLADGALRSRARVSTSGGAASAPRRSGCAARDGFMIAFLNPKLAVFMLALFAPFTSADQPLAAKAVMVLTIGCIDALWYAAVVLVVVRAGLLPILERRAVMIDRLFGLLLLVLAVFVASRAVEVLV
jgi:threonine/homoserine/homoserine lactone efflux protein